MERLGRYEIEAEIGRGAMGRVYRARDPQIDRVVAVKTVTLGGIEPTLEEDFRQRFFREARAAGRLAHGNIVAVYDAGEDAETRNPYIVMEYVEGTGLEKLGREKKLAREQALELIRQVAEALDYAHQQKIIHRDIKPANILVTADGRAKISDFGIAKLQTSQFTQTGMVMGTPAYMAPEQLSGETVDHRADLFSLGTVLYWLLTGEKPFSGESLATLSFKIVYSEPLRPSQLNPGLGEDIDYVLHRALAKEAARRYQSGREFATDLEDLLHNRALRSRAQPAAVQPETPAASADQLASSWAALAAALRRRPLLMGVGAAVLVAVLAGLTWMMQGPESPATSEGPPATTPDASSSEPAKPETGAAEPARIPPPSSPTRTPAGTSSRAPAEGPRQPLPTATLKVQGRHSFRRAALTIYVDGRLERQIPLATTQASEAFQSELALSAGDRVITVSVRDDSGRVLRSYLTGNIRAGQSRSLLISFDRASISLRWLD